MASTIDEGDKSFASIGPQIFWVVSGGVFERDEDDATEERERKKDSANVLRYQEKIQTQRNLLICILDN